jgi:hypothetical protein
MENMEFIMTNKEQGRKICKVLEKNATSLETTCAKMGQMRGMTKILMEGQERITKHV